MRRVLRGTGWLLVAAGVIVLLYLVYQLLFTNTVTNAAQEQLLEEWNAQVPAPEPEPEPRPTLTQPAFEDQDRRRRARR